MKDNLIIVDNKYIFAVEDDDLVLSRELVKHYRNRMVEAAKKDVAEGRPASIGDFVATLLSKDAIDFVKLDSVENIEIMGADFYQNGQQNPAAQNSPAPNENAGGQIPAGNKTTDTPAEQPARSQTAQSGRGSKAAAANPAPAAPAANTKNMTPPTGYGDNPLANFG
jgi:hypothetical protein